MSLPRKESGYWNLKNCKSEALKYTNKSEFSRKSPGAYQSAYKNGWLSKICLHFKTKYKAKGYWDFNNCKIEALKYKTKTEFEKYATSAYQAALKNKWLNSICTHMVSNRNFKGFWNKENCSIEANKYSFRSDFQKYSRSAYSSAIKNGWLEEISEHMRPRGNGYLRFGYALEFPKLKEVYVGITTNPNRRKWQHISIINGKCISSNKFVKKNIENRAEFNWIINSEISNKDNAKSFEEKNIAFYIQKGWYLLNIAKAGALGSDKKYWTKEKCRKEALKYSRRVDFSKNNSSAYNSARENNWLKEICEHMTTNKKAHGFWNNKELCAKEASKHFRKVDFQKKSPTAYNAALRNGWLNEITKHINSTIKPVGYWNKDQCQEEALKYLSRSEFQKFSGSAYAAAQKNGWLDEVCKNMALKKKKANYWNFEKCEQAAKQFQTRSEFSVKASSAYNKAKKNNWLDLICKHMVPIHYQKGYWTLEKCKEAANSYSSRMQFKKGNPKAYDATRSKGWLNIIFKSKS